jgi:CRISPR-associated protein (TIGR02584 family)
MIKKNILLCVAGMTPQIITETLYALTQQNGETVDEIRVITTLEGRNKVLKSLLDKDEGKFFEFCRDYRIDAQSIKFDETTIALLDTPDGKTLDDIRTPEENTLAGDKICKIVAELCKDEKTRIHASAAGGRKTMSIYLTAAMSLFGRAEDALSHILVNEDFEGHPNFFYPPPQHKTLKITHRITKEVLREVSTADARIYLAEIPFIRLRGIGAKAFDEKTQTYRQAVDKAQRDLRLAETAGELRLDLRRNVVKVADRQVKLSLREIFVYALFAHFRQKNFGENGFVNLKQINREHLETICRMISKAKDDEVGFEDFETLPKADFVRRLDVSGAGKIIYQKKAQRFFKKYGRKPEKGEIRVSEEEGRKLIVKNLREILGKMEPKLKAVFAPAELFEEFYIERRGEKEAYIFGFRIEPERIKFEVEEN